MIILTPTRITAACIAITFFLLFIQGYCETAILFISHSNSFTRRLIGLGMLFALLPFIALITGIRLPWPLLNWIVFAVAFLLPILIGLPAAIRERGGPQPFMERWWQNSASVLPAVERNSEAIDLRSVMSASILMFLIFYCAGWRYAGLDWRQQVLDTDTSQAFIVVYGDRWFFRPIQELESYRDPTEPANLLVLSGSQVENITLKRISRSNAP